LTEQVDFTTSQPALDQLNVTATGLQLAVRFDVPPDAMEAGEAVSVQTGVRLVTVTIALATAPVPEALIPATV
jgi:hypothetical protein